MKGLRKFWAFVLSLLSFTILLALHPTLDVMALGIGIAGIAVTFMAGNAAVHIKGSNGT